MPLGEPNGNLGALPGNRSDLDFPLMVTDNLVYPYEAHAHAMGFGGKKGVEDLRQIVD
jgi:hypothetical protein